MTWNRVFQNQIWTFIFFYPEYLIVGFAITSTVLSSDSFMFDTIKMITITTNNNLIFFQPTGDTVCSHNVGFFSCFSVCRSENCVWKVITEEINWTTGYIITSQIFEPVKIHIVWFRKVHKLMHILVKPQAWSSSWQSGSNLDCKLYQQNKNKPMMEFIPFISNC